MKAFVYHGPKNMSLDQVPDPKILKSSSEQRGIEGCKIFMKDSDSYDLDDYVQKVTEYKHYLEQSLDSP